MAQEADCRRTSREFWQLIVQGQRSELIWIIWYILSEMLLTSRYSTIFGEI